MVRFAVTMPGSDPQSVVGTSTTMRVWVTHEDVYVGSRQGAKTLKLSFHGARPHQAEAWQLGYTKEHHLSAEEPLWIGPDRIIQTWRPTPFVNGFRTMLVMDFHRGSLRTQAPDPAAVHLEFPVGLEGIVRVRLVETERPAKGVAGQVGDPLILSSGRQVWLSAEALQDPGAMTAEASAADAVIMVPSTIEVDGVAVPRLEFQGGALDWESFANHLPACPWPKPPSPRHSAAPQGPFASNA